MRLFLGKLRGWGLILALATALGAVGCGPSTGTVTGKVVYTAPDGPHIVKGGFINFHAADDRDYNTGIKEDGTYRIEKVPVGEAKVTVATSSLAPPKSGPPSGATPPNDPNAGNAEKNKALYVPIPPGYGDPEKSGLKYTVTAGNNTYDPPLK